MSYWKKSLYGLLLLLLTQGISAQIFLEQPPLYNPDRITATSEQTNLIDIEGDGDLDLLVSASTNNNQLQVFVNNGTDLDSVFILFDFDNLTDISLSSSALSDIEVVDLDHDNDDDIVTRFGRTVVVHRNNGEGVFTPLELDFEFSGAFVNVIGMEFGDVDNDGTTDIVFGTFQPGEVIWAKGTGNLNFDNTAILITAAQLQTTGVSRISSIAIFDVDNDGDSDLFITHQLTSGTTDAGYLAINNGGGDYTVPQIFNVPRSTTAIADFNGDGFIDFAKSTNTGDGDITYYLNDGANDFSPTVLRNFSSVMSTIRPNNVFAADVDNDGDQDIIAGLVGAFSSGRAAIYFNDGMANFSNETIVFVATNFATFQQGTQTIKENSILPFDFDDDGDIDFITNSQADGNISLQINQGDGSYSTQVLNIQIEELTNLQHLDLNKDGFEDIIAVSASSNQGKLLASFGNARGGFDPARVLITRNAFIPEDGLVTDLDKDGNWDYVYANSRELNWVSNFLTNGGNQLLYTSQFVTDERSDGRIGFINSPQRAFQVADIDNDGDNDVLVADMAVSSGGKMAWLENDGNENFTTRTLSIDIGSYQLADINNDETLDLITLSFVNSSGADFRVYSLNEATNQLSLAINKPLTYDGRLASQEFTIADPDMDGDNDVILNGMDWIENNGDGTFEDVVSLFNAPTGVQGSFSRIIASDINGDGAPDFVGSAATNTPSQFVAINNGDNTFTLADELIQPVATPDGRVIRFISADLNEDGLQDIITGRQTGESLTVELFETSLKSRQTITFPTISLTSYGDISTLSATSDAGLMPTYESSSASLATVEGDELTLRGVGEVTITAQFPENDNFIAGEASQTININPVSLNISADAQSRPYGSENPELTITYDGFVLDDDASDLTGLTISTTAQADSPIGSYPISITGVMSDNYTLNINDNNLTVNRAILSAIADDQTKVYGEANPSLTLSYQGFVLGEDANVLTAEPVLSVSADETSNVGEFTINVSGGTADNYEIVGVNGVLDITPATLSTTTEMATRIYGAANPEITITYNGFVNGDDASAIATAPTVSIEADASSPVGEYAVTLSGGQSNNYQFDFAEGILTVTPAPLVGTVDDKTRVYGVANPELTLSYTGFVNGDSEAAFTTAPSVSTAALATSDVGEYNITATGGDALNYEFSFESGTLTVTQAMLMATADNQTRVYGEENPELTIRYDGFVNDDDITALTTTPVASTAAMTSSNVGEYPIVLMGGESLNYSIVTAPGLLTVTQAMLTATANNETREYGASNPDFTISYEGFVNGDDASAISVTPAASTTADATSAVGEYPITLSGGEALNYSMNLIAGTLTVSQALLTATADDQTRNYGEENPELTISYAGFVNGDDAAILTSVPTVSTTTDVNTSVGEYPITIAGGVAQNYSLALVSGTLMITPATLTATANDQMRTYGAENPTFEITYSGFVNGDTEAMITPPMATANTDATSPVGVYMIELNGGAAANYLFSFVNGNLNITKATLTATAIDATRNKGESNPDFQIEYMGFVNGETADVLDTAPTASTNATQISDRGTYDIVLAGGDDNNYAFELINGTLTVTGPVFDLPASISFDLLTLGDVGTEDITFNNTGDGELNVNGIALPAGYTVDQTSFNVANGAMNAITLTFTPTEARVYNGDMVISTNDGERSISLSGEGQIVTGVDDDMLDLEEVKLYPNPVREWLTIDLSDSPATSANVRLVNPSGQPVWQRKEVKESSVRVHTAAYSQGMYLVIIETNRGSVIKKVWIQH